jgi:CubicO group peptidase (beta-lactamase class C family)
VRYLAAAIAACLLGCFSPPADDSDTGDDALNAASGDKRAAFEKSLLPVMRVEGEEPKPATIQERMKFYGVPGVSIVVIDEGKVAWSAGYGYVEAGGAPITPDTLFQGASISKAMTALGTMRLAERGELALDVDVNTLLTESWRVPEPDPSVGASKPVTLRGLLTHTAGINEDKVKGYKPGAALPTLEQALAGVPPANNKAVRVVEPPGQKWIYSNSGYTIVQKALIDTSGKDFPGLMKTLVLDPLGMTESSFERPGDGVLTRKAARGHENGLELKGSWLVDEPFLAAGGLWTTAKDLARVVLDIQKGLAGGGSKILSKETLEQMIETSLKQRGSTAEDDHHMGLGLFLEGRGDDLRFQHDGANKGFRAMFLGYAHKGQGAVVMTNGDEEAYYLKQEILASIAKTYGWKGVEEPEPILLRRLAPAAVDEYVGTYTMTDGPGKGTTIEITRRDDRLYGDITALDTRIWLLPQPGKKEEFSSLLDRSASIQFEKDEAGHVTGASFAFFDIEPMHGTKASSSP